VVGDFRADITLVWVVLDRASAGWRGVTVTSDRLRLLQDLHRSPLEHLRDPATHRHRDPAR
jgi:putative transposase